VIENRNGRVVDTCVIHPLVERYVDASSKGPIEQEPEGQSAQYDMGPTSCAAWLWDARERVAFAGRTTLAFASVVIPGRRRSYIAADIPGSRS